MSAPSVAFTTEVVGEGRWKWAVWLEVDSPEQLDRITSVTYTLPSSMRNPVRTSTDRATAFRIEGEAWAEFVVYVVANETGTTGHQFEQRIELLYSEETARVPRAALAERIAASGAKRLLSIDGGGARTLITLPVLERIEDLLQQRAGNPDLVLADYFDLVSGSSVGAVIATGIAMGMPVAQLRNQFLGSLPKLFTQAGILQRFRSRYVAKDVAGVLKTFVGDDTTLASSKLRTGLMIALYNASNDAEWLVTNSPAAEVNNPRRPDSPLHVPLWQLLRGATAAPAYFEPEVVRLGSRDVVVMDAGVTAIGCLGFRTFLTVTAPEMGFGWKSSESDLLLASLGSGFTSRSYTPSELINSNLVVATVGLIDTLIQSARFEQDRLCRIFGRSVFAPALPEASQQLLHAHPVEAPLFRYMRYDHSLDQGSLDELGFRDVKSEEIVRMDNVEAAETFGRLGQAIARNQVRLSHFEGF